MKFILSLAFSVLGIAWCYSQANYMTLTGKIVNHATDEPISYATLSHSARGINTMSNDKGEFIFKIPVTGKTDSILISHVGYRPIIFLADAADTVYLLVKLQENIPELPDVTVKAVNASDLVKQAIAKIPRNYPATPYLLTGFYRLTGSKEKNIVHMSEAVFDIYNNDYARKKKQVKLIKSRFDKDLTAFNGNNSFNFGSSPEDILDYDIVSNVNESDLLNSKELKDYQFTYKGVIDYNGSEAYEIGFDQKDGIKKSLKQGTMIIDAGNLAFLEFRFRLSPKGIKYWSLGFSKKMLLSLSRIRIDILQDSSVVTYRKYGDKYYLNHVKGLSLWHILGGRDRFELNPFRLKNDYLVTSIDTVSAKPFTDTEEYANSRFLENLTHTEDTGGIDSFWNEYNLIHPEFNVDSVARIINKNNLSLSHKDLLEKSLEKVKKDKAVRIDSILSFYHRMDQFNGNALIEYNGNIICQKSFGLAIAEKQLSNNNMTQFRIGSASKQFTSMLIMQLVKEGKIAVDDPVGKFLPEYIHGKLTIQQLMTHQSGIPNYTNNEEYLAKTVVKKYSPVELVRLFCSDSLEFEPGTTFHYSNSGYVVLALVIEKITGTSYAAVLKEKIFKPLGMNNSFFGSESPLATNMATGYINDQPERAYAVENIAGAGGITSTTEDLLRWNQALSSATLMSSTLLISESEINEIFKPRVEWKEWGADYGYGWMIDRLSFKVSAKHTIQFHPGTEPGFYSMLIRQPDKGIVIILLNNKGEFPRFEMSDLILNELNR